MLGIDVSKQHLACTQLDPHTRRVLWSASIPNTPAGLSQLCQRVPAECPWVLEPTGRYSNLAVEVGTAQGRQVLLASPRQAKAFLASVQSRAKTDRLDSQGLALYALSQPLRPFPVKSAAVEELTQLLRARRGLTKARASLKLQRAELPHAQAAFDAALASLDAEVEGLDARIKALAADREAFPQVAELQKVPGIGSLTAVSLATCLYSKNFTHPDQFVAYVGLDIGVRQSGQRCGDVGLTRQGDAELRRLLYLAALTNTRISNSPFHTQYQRERAKGLAGTAAVCAVARKLARLAWSLVKHKSTYNPARVHQQPAPSPPTDRSSPPDITCTQARA